MATILLLLLLYIYTCAPHDVQLFLACPIGFPSSSFHFQWEKRAERVCADDENGRPFLSPFSVAFPSLFRKQMKIDD